LMNEAKTIGIRVFLQKPFKAEELIAAISRILKGEA